MTSLGQISEYSKKISDVFSPEKIILFGSYAYGNPTPDSDVDLLVVMEDRNFIHKPSLEIRRRIKPPFPLDIIVKTPSSISKRLKMRDYFLHEIINKGIVLYERRDA